MGFIQRYRCSQITCSFILRSACPKHHRKERRLHASSLQSVWSIFPIHMYANPSSHLEVQPMLLASPAKLQKIVEAAFLGRLTCMTHKVSPVAVWRHSRAILTQVCVHREETEKSGAKRTDQGPQRRAGCDNGIPQWRAQHGATAAGGLPEPPLGRRYASSLPATLCHFWQKSTHCQCATSCKSFYPSCLWLRGSSWRPRVFPLREHSCLLQLSA